MSLLSEILSSKVRAEIFRILFGINREEVHMREIERRAGLSIGTIQTELKKLSSLDLVKRRQDGNRIYFSANTSHPLYRDVRSMVLKTNGLAEILRQVLTQASEIQAAFVFGSIARNEEKADSDVDLLIIGDTGLRDATKLLSGISEQIGREINPYVMKKEEFLMRKKENEHFISQVLAGSKLYIIGNDDDLAAMG